MSACLSADRINTNLPGVTARRRRAGDLAGVMGAAGMLIAPTLALAQGPQSTDMSVVTVKGRPIATSRITKLPAKLQDISQSVTVLSKPLLQAQGAISLGDALRSAPGITIGGAEGSQIGNNINLNGFTARTDIYLDGFRDRGQYYRDTFALDEVEVLMGPSSMLFGRGSTGGVINQVSKRPLPTSLTELEVSATTNGLVRGTADVNAPVSDNAAVRIAAMGQGGPISTRRQTTVSDYGVAPSFSWGIGTPTQITVASLFQHNQDRPDYGVSPLNGRPVQSGFDTVYGYATDRTIQDVKAASLEVKHRFAGGIAVRDQLQFNGVDTDAIETAPQGIGTVGSQGYAAASPAGISALPLSQLWARLQSHDRVIHDTSLFNQLEVSADVRAGPFAHSLLAGVEFGHDAYENQAYTRTGSCNGVALPLGYTGCVPVLNPPYARSPVMTEAAGNLARGKADTEAVYFNDMVTVLPQLKLVGGVRYDNFDASISNSVNKLNTPGNTAFASLHQTVGYASVRTGVIWQPTKTQSYYFSYSTSFNPSLEQLTSTTGVSQPLPPETNTAYEVGGKWDVLDQQLNLTAAAFQITQDNSRSQNADNTYTANGVIRVQGVRLGAAGRIAPGWKVYGGYTHLDARIVQAIAVGTQGKVPLNTPADTATLWTTYAIAHNWEVGGGATYMSSRFLNNTDLVSVPGYVRVDGTVAFHMRPIEVRLNVFNLFDARYYDSLIQSDGGRAVPGSGRTAMITLSYRR